MIEFNRDIYGRFLLPEDIPEAPDSITATVLRPTEEYSHAFGKFVLQRIDRNIYASSISDFDVSDFNPTEVYNAKDLYNLDVKILTNGRPHIPLEESTPQEIYQERTAA